VCRVHILVEEEESWCCALNSVIYSFVDMFIPARRSLQILLSTNLEVCVHTHIDIQTYTYISTTLSVNMFIAMKKEKKTLTEAFLNKQLRKGVWVYVFTYRTTYRTTRS
jgi:hypothetical protein